MSQFLLVFDQMENKEALVIITNTFLIHLMLAFNVPSFMINNGNPANVVLAINVSIGVSLLLFLVFGLIADV